MTEQSDRHRAYWSRAGFAEGVRLALPVMPGMVLFGAAFGALAAQKGLSLFEAALMSAVVYAGASQFVALEMWSDIATLAGMLHRARTIEPPVHRDRLRDSPTTLVKKPGMYATHLSFICPSPDGVLTGIYVSPHSSM